MSYSPTQDDVQRSEAARMARNGYANTRGVINSDPMLQRSADSAAMVEYWDLTDCIVDGINAVRLASSDYLPKFTDEESCDYEFRLKCTKMTNIYRDAIEGLASKPFEQEVALQVDEKNPIPDQLAEFIEDVDGSGNNLTIFASATFFNGINSAIDWILIDYDKPNAAVRTVADQKAIGIRPYWSHVLGRNVLEVRSKVIAGKEVLTYVRVYEPGKPDHVRVFERSETGVVIWTLYVDTGKTISGTESRFAVDDQGTMTIDVIPMVPFITGRRDGRSWRFFPAMRDAADLQIELYQQESALKFVKILAAYPMLAGNGVKPPMTPDGTPKKLGVGPGRVLYAPPDGSGTAGTWTFVEPSGSTMTFLASDTKETMMQLRELARQPLTAQSGNLTVITTAVAAGKGKSAVKAWALALKDTLENAMVITDKWFGINPETYDPVVNVFTEFDEFLEGKDLDTLLAARAAKDISQLTYWEELKRRAVLSPEFNSKVEEQRLLDELPGDGIDTTAIQEGMPNVDA